MSDDPLRHITHEEQPPRPTDDEIKRVQAWLRWVKCGEQGHDMKVVLDGTGAPDSLLCERCGKVWRMA